MKNRNLAINPARLHSIRLLAVHIVALMALAFGTGNVLAQTSGTWTLDGSSNWGVTTSWSGGLVANGAGATADFSVFAPTTSSNKNMTLEISRTIGFLKLGNGGSRTTNILSSGGTVLILDNNLDLVNNPSGNGTAEITFKNGGKNGSTGAAVELKSNLLITNSDSGGNNGILISGGLSSTNGNLLITNNSNLASRTKFNSTVSDGTGTISYSQTTGWTEFNNANTFTGTTTNVAGTMILGTSLALQNSALDTTASGVGNNVANGNGLKIKGTATALTLGGLIGNKDFSTLFNTVIDGNNLGYVAVTALTLNPGTGKSNSYSGVIANGAANMTLTKTGAGTQILTNAANTYSGQTSINGGILSVGASGNLGNASATNTLSINGGTLQATESFDAGSNRSLTVGASGGTVGVASTKALTVSGAISGGGNTLNKTGAGELILSNASNTVGTTNVNAGKLTLNSGAQLTSTTVSVSNLGSALEVNGTLAGNLTTASGTILSGTGTIGTNTSSTATISGTHNPGNSPGIQNFLGNLSYTGGASVVNWELKGNTSANAANPNAIFDQIIVGGNLDFTDPTVLNLSFTPTGSGVLWSDSFWNTSQSWTIYDVTGSPLNYSKLSLVTTDWLDSGSNLFNTARAGSSFSLDLTGQDVILKYAAGAAPEPSRAMLMLIGAAGLLMRRRRKW